MFIVMKSLLIVTVTLSSPLHITLTGKSVDGFSSI